MALFGRKKRRLERLLIVEDEPLIAFDNEYFLADEGFIIVDTLASAAAAVARLREGAAIDLVLTDFSLANGSGMDVARAASERGVPVLFVTARCPAEAREVAVGCLAKPYSQRDLSQAIDAIDAMLEGRAVKRRPAGLHLFAVAATDKTSNQGEA